MGIPTQRSEDFYFGQTFKNDTGDIKVRDLCTAQFWRIDRGSKDVRPCAGNTRFYTFGWSQRGIWSGQKATSASSRAKDVAASFWCPTQIMTVAYWCGSCFFFDHCSEELQVWPSVGHWNHHFEPLGFDGRLGRTFWRAWEVAPHKHHSNLANTKPSFTNIHTQWMFFSHLGGC